MLYAQDVDQRSATFEKALEVGTLYQNRAKLMVFRSALLKNNISIKTPSREQGGVDMNAVANWRQAKSSKEKWREVWRKKTDPKNRS